MFSLLNWFSDAALPDVHTLDPDELAKVVQVMPGGGRYDPIS